MSMENLDQAFKLIQLHDDRADFDGPKSDELLSKAEQALELSFPPCYRAFLSRLGCGDIAGLEFYGVIREDFDDSGIPDAIWLTLDERTSSQLPASHIIVAETGDGGYYAIDCSDSSNGECPVVQWWPGANKQEMVASDFGEFLLRSIQIALGRA
jgi:hypothetical protein